MARAVLRTIPASIAGVLVRDLSSVDLLRPAAAGARWMTHVEEIDDVPFECAWILVSDRSVTEVAQQLAERPVSWDVRFAFHSSGSETSKTLLPLATVGCVTGVVHPNGTFSGDTRIPHDLVWTLSRHIPTPWRLCLEQLLHGIRPVFVEIDDAVRPLYHAAASVAANYLVTLLGLAHELYKAAGFDDTTATAIVDSFARQAVVNTCRLGARGALTGPIARGDIDVLLRQVRAIHENARQDIEVFIALARATARLGGTYDAVSAGLDRLANETGRRGIPRDAE